MHLVFGRQAVRCRGEALQFASEQLRKDRTLVQAAVRQSGAAARRQEFSTPNFSRSGSLQLFFLLLLVRVRPFSTHRKSCEETAVGCWSLGESPGALVAALEATKNSSLPPCLLAPLSRSVQGPLATDRAFLVGAVALHPMLLSRLGEEIRSDRDFLLEAWKNARLKVSDKLLQMPSCRGPEPTRWCFGRVFGAQQSSSVSSGAFSPSGCVPGRSSRRQGDGDDGG